MVSAAMGLGRTTSAALMLIIAVTPCMSTALAEPEARTLEPKLLVSNFLVSNLLVIDGEVVDVRSRWTADQSAIVSEVSVRASDGSVVVMHQLGGSVDGIGMIVSHHPRPLEKGQRVRAALSATGTSYVLREVLAREPAPSDSATYASVLAEDPVIARYGVNRTNATQKPIYWPSGCIYMAYDAAGTSDISDNDEFAILDQAASEWETETSVCSGLAFSSTLVTQPGVGRDRLNTVVWREDRWCRPATATTPEVCHDPNAIAVTQVFYIDDAQSPRDGEIVEADMEFNGVNFAFTVDGVSLGQAARLADLQSTMTHELGHLLGLTHNCWTNLEEPPTDHEGRLVPSCGEVLPGSEAAEATMYYLQEEGETKKSSLETSDVLGSCATMGHRACDRVVHGGCSAAPGQARQGLVQVAVFLALMLLLGRLRPGRRYQRRGRAWRRSGAGS